MAYLCLLLHIKIILNERGGGGVRPKKPIKASPNSNLKFIVPFGRGRVAVAFGFFVFRYFWNFFLFSVRDSTKN